MLVPFVKPSTAPVTDEQQDAYNKMDDMIDEGVLSSVCGWAIRQRQIVANKEKLKARKSHLRHHFKGRSVLNWTLVAVCLEQVRLIELD